MYFGFWWKPSNPWQDQTAGNKIVFPDVGTNHTFLIMMPGNHEIWAQLDFGADNSHLLNAGPSAPGPINVWGNRVTVSLGQWHRIEGHMKKSTNSTSRDGILRWWVDGVNAGNYTNVNYLGTFQEFQFSPTWGGVGGTKTENDYYWYDHVRISIPGTGTTPPPPPPPPSSSSLYFNSSESGCNGSDPNVLWCDDFERGYWAKTMADPSVTNGGWNMTPFPPAGSWHDSAGTNFGCCGGQGVAGTNCAVTSGFHPNAIGQAPAMGDHSFNGTQSVDDIYMRH